MNSFLPIIIQAPLRSTRLDPTEYMRIFQFLWIYAYLICLEAKNKTIF